MKIVDLLQFKERSPDVLLDTQHLRFFKNILSKKVRLICDVFTELFYRLLELDDT